MRIFLLVALSMCAFAANSVLTRIALADGTMDPVCFALVRVAAGALVLGMLMTLRDTGLPLWRWNRLPGAISLAVYMIGFSLAYLTLDAGLGALILFGTVQISMFTHGALRGAPPSGRQVTGAGIAFAGLLLALWPGPGGMANPIGAALMMAAGIGWAAYTIIGKRARDPLSATSANFLLCLVTMIALAPLMVSGLEVHATGIALGVLCGGVTSGLGYALWYHVLPQLDTATTAIVQLSVPILAIGAGVILLGEDLTPMLVVSAGLVLGGIGWAVSGR